MPGDLNGPSGQFPKPATGTLLCRFAWRKNGTSALCMDQPMELDVCRRLGNGPLVRFRGPTLLAGPVQRERQIAQQARRGSLATRQTPNGFIEELHGDGVTSRLERGVALGLERHGVIVHEGLWRGRLRCQPRREILRMRSRRLGPQAPELSGP